MHWMKTEKGAYLNLDHCDLIEVQEDAKSATFRLVGWNAYNSAAQPHILRTFDTRKDADAALERLIAMLGKGIADI